MKNAKIGNWMRLAILFVAVLYTALLLFVKSPMEPTSWALYAFSLVALALLAIQCGAIHIDGGAQTPGKLTSFYVTLLFAAIQFVVGGVVLMAVDGLPLAPVLCVEGLFFGAYFVCIFVMNGVISAGESGETDDSRIKDFKRTVAQIEGIAEQIQDEQTSKAVLQLADALRYQDALIPSEIAYIDEEIGRCVESMQALVENHNEDAIQDQIVTLGKLLSDRKREAKIYR